MALLLQDIYIGISLHLLIAMKSRLCWTVLASHETLQCSVQTTSCKGHNMGHTLHTPHWHEDLGRLTGYSGSSDNASDFL